jgi:hypothetical protein
MKPQKNYIDERGNYHNVENLTLTQIHDRASEEGYRLGKVEALAWVPVTYRPMTEEEEKKLCEDLGIKEGSLEDWEKKVFTCKLPDDGQEILISLFGKFVQEDICSWDEYGCGLENNGDWDGVDAWMPKPEPYKKGGQADE